ncbi:unnamed protein product [Dracunculus medinensis]|uniref:Helicase ATP-binding domain-containing protein n=1 Tax=Dracunculus medinensis TaxID=318479 RepID=A0A0N4UQS4_DRAME|nr:unnamed protein product [Dracunculus medinensis]
MSDSSSEDEIQNLRSDKKCEVSDNLENGAIKRIDTGDGVENKTFEMLGVRDVLCEACTRLGWKFATKVQSAALPHALAGKDIIGLAETGSGKTAAFALPILQALLETPQKLFALILTPTRELAFQIGEQFEALGTSIGLLVG